MDFENGFSAWTVKIFACSTVQASIIFRTSTSTSARFRAGRGGETEFPGRVGSSRAAYHATPCRAVLCCAVLCRAVRFYLSEAEAIFIILAWPERSVLCFAE